MFNWIKVHAQIALAWLLFFFSDIWASVKKFAFFVARSVLLGLFWFLHWPIRFLLNLAVWLSSAADYLK